MKFQVTAAHRSTGQQRTFVMNCSSPDEASARADSEGFMVYSVKPINPAGTTPPKPPVVILEPAPEPLPLAPRPSIAYRLGQFARRRPRRFGVLMILFLAFVGWGAWRQLFAPIEVEHPQTARVGDVEISVWTVKDYDKADGLVVLNIVNHSFDMKLDVNFDAVKVSDEAGNQYAVRSVRGESGEQQTKTSLYPGYRLRQPLVLERLLDKDLYVRIGSEFCSGFKSVVIKVSSLRIDRYQNAMAIHPIDWTQDNRVYMADGRTMFVSFAIVGEKIVARAKGNKPSKSAFLKPSFYLYLYDADGRLVATGFD